MLHTFSEVAGIDISVPIASITAFITAGGAAIVPASPHPLAPNGFDVAGVEVKPSLIFWKIICPWHCIIHI